MRHDTFASFRRSVGRELRRWAGTFRRATAPRRPREENDAEQVEAAARLLQVSDFEFFRIAHSGWYGRESTEEETERAFAPYLLRREIPFWVRHLARRVLELHSRKALDPRDFGVAHSPPLREGCAVKVICGVLLGVLYSFFFLALGGYVSP